MKRLLAEALALGLARRGVHRRRTSNCSTSLTIRPANSTPSSTRRSPKSGKAETGETVTISSRTAARASRRARSSMGSKPTSSRSPWPTTSTRLPKRRGSSPADWQKRLPHNSLALHLDHRLPRPQGQPEGDQGLGRPGQARRRGDHAQSQDLGRRALELPGRLGLCAEARTAATKQGTRVRDAALQERAGARLRCPRFDHHLCPARHR